MKTFKTSEFTKQGITFITKRSKLGYLPYSKFKAPKKIELQGIGFFTYKSLVVNKISGIQYMYTSDLFDGTSQSGLRVKFW
tara:strand:- start:277 stop:519 length:243 start_codon:yes stop_codon:yes gene_type:complete